MNGLFLQILNISISASWLVLAVLLLRLVLKKAPKWVNVLLWGLVAVRLICPFFIESPLSLIPSAETVPMNIALETAPAIDGAGNPAGRQTDAPSTGAGSPFRNAAEILGNIWLLGAAALLIYSAVSYWRLRRRIETAVLYQDPVYQSENVASPFVLGIIRPKIYLPFQLGGREMEHVVAHELAHIRRRDHWWKPLGFLLLTIHWFNPLMWLAYVLLCRDIELAADERVIKDLGNEQRADYTQALVACSGSRRTIAACPLAFGEVGVKERVKSVMKYRKSAAWLVALSIVACVIAAACFLTNPMRFQFDETRHTIVSASCLDMRANADAAPAALSPAQRSELSNRLAGINSTRSGDKFAGSTPKYQVTALLEDGTCLTVSGYSPSAADEVDIAWNGRRYVVSDSGFHAYLSRICSGGDPLTAASEPPVTKWFDYLAAPNEMKWDGHLEINVPAFPDVTFRWYPDKIEAEKGGKIIPLYSGMPIWNTYFCDLTGDGLPELCSSLSIGSGIVDNRIIIYDYANGVSYSLEDRMTYDYTLRLYDGDGRLYVDQRDYLGGELLSSGRLVFEDNCIRVLAHETASASATDMADPTSRTSKFPL